MDTQLETIRENAERAGQMHGDWINFYREYRPSNEELANLVNWAKSQLGITTAMPWDSNDNRHYEPVEKRAAQIYAAYPYDGAGEKPDWFPHGNSHMQERARHTARMELRKAGHQQQ